MRDKLYQVLSGVFLTHTFCSGRIGPGEPFLKHTGLQRLVLEPRIGRTLKSSQSSESWFTRKRRDRFFLDGLLFIDQLPTQ